MEGIEDVVMALLATLFCALATARITRLIVADTITEAARGALLRRFGPTSLVVTLVFCDWCVGWWASVGVVVVALAAGLWPSALAALLGIPATAYMSAGIIRAIEKSGE